MDVRHHFLCQAKPSRKISFIFRRMLFHKEERCSCKDRNNKILSSSSSRMNYTAVGRCVGESQRSGEFLSSFCLAMIYVHRIHGLHTSTCPAKAALYRNGRPNCRKTAIMAPIAKNNRPILSENTVRKIRQQNVRISEYFTSNFLQYLSKILPIYLVIIVGEK